MKKPTTLAIILFFSILLPANGASKIIYITGPGLETYSLKFDYEVISLTSSNEFLFFVNVTMIFDQFSTKILSNLNLSVYIESSNKTIVQSVMASKIVNGSMGVWMNSTELFMRYETGTFDLKFDLTFFESSDNGNTFQTAEFLDNLLDSFELSAPSVLINTYPLDSSTFQTEYVDPPSETKLPLSLGLVLSFIVIATLIGVLTNSSSKRRRRYRLKKLDPWRKPMLKPLTSKPAHKGLKKSCMSCGTPVSKIDSFCFNCGVKID